MNILLDAIARGLICAIVTASITACSSTQSGESSSSSERKPSVRNNDRAPNLESEFERVSNDFLSAIVTGRQDFILSLWSKKGVVQGIDGPLVSSREVRSDFAKKAGLFCLIFDTACLRALPGFERMYSYRDMLSKVATKEKKFQVIRYGKSLMGELRVELHGGVMDELEDIVTNPLEFDFIHEDGEWKLATLP
jgi:hypothetical protein